MSGKWTTSERFVVFASDSSAEPELAKATEGDRRSLHTLERPAIYVASLGVSKEKVLMLVAKKAQTNQSLRRLSLR
jgi:hypothetical protein